MNTKDKIESITQLDKNKLLSTDIKWSKVKEKPKYFAKPKVKGEMPFNLNDYYKLNGSYLKNDEIFKEESKKYDFSEITTSLRNAMGPSLQNNKVIEKYISQRKNKIVSNNDITNQNSNALNTPESLEVSSSNLVDENFWESNHSIKLAKNKKLEGAKRPQYSRHTLSNGLIMHKKICSNSDDNTTELKDDFLTESEVFDDNKDALIDNRSDNATGCMNNFVEVFESQEVDDVYYHPLMEQIKTDPEWQAVKLKRKGEQIVESSRNFYMNFDDDSFKFE